jgi:hypothetical protein
MNSDEVQIGIARRTRKVKPARRTDLRYNHTMKLAATAPHSPQITISRLRITTASWELLTELRNSSFPKTTFAK